MRRLALPLAVLLAACTPAAPPAGGPTTTYASDVTAIPTPAGAIVGNYTVTLVDADVPGTMPADAHASLVGTWSIMIHPQNHFVATFNGNQVVEGPYQVSGNRIIFPAGDSGQYACERLAMYTWQRGADGRLTFTPVGEDACAGRAVVLTSHPLAPAP